MTEGSQSYGAHGRLLHISLSVYSSLPSLPVGLEVSLEEIWKYFDYFCKILVSETFIFVAVSMEVQLCLYCSLVTMRTQPLFSGQPGLSVLAYLHCQVMLTQSVLSVGCLVSDTVVRYAATVYCLFRAT